MVRPKESQLFHPMGGVGAGSCARAKEQFTINIIATVAPKTRIGMSRTKKRRWESFAAFNTDLAVNATRVSKPASFGRALIPSRFNARSRSAHLRNPEPRLRRSGSQEAMHQTIEAR